jgi:hypothetical protein
VSDPGTPAGEAEGAAAGGGDHSARNARILRWLIQATSLAALKGEAAAIARSAGIRAMLKAVMALLWMLVAGFLLAAFVIWLAGIVGAIPACAIVAAVFAVAALIVQLIGARMARRRPRWHLTSAFPGLADAVRNGTVDDSALGVLLLAGLAGLFLGPRGKH